MADGTAEHRRRELADFLRTRRARLQPEDVGLPRGGRRRTPGLRREEVALIAGVGATWYTWLEQGREVRASLEVLEAIAGAMRLTAAERAHLVLLGRGEPPPPRREQETVTPHLRRLVESIDPYPAMVIGRRWDYLAWNRAASAIFGDFGAVPVEARNLIWLAFTDPTWRLRWPRWEQTAPPLVAKFRADHARHLGDPGFEEMIAALKRVSPEFAAAWRQHDVAHGGGGTNTLHHQDVGPMRFETAIFTLQDEDGQRLIHYSPIDDELETPAKLARLLAD